MSLLPSLSSPCSTSSALLKTSYVKFIDVWYFGTLCVPFFKVLVAT